MPVFFASVLELAVLFESGDAGCLQLTAMPITANTDNTPIIRFLHKEIPSQ